MRIKIAVAVLAVALGSSVAVAQPRWYGVAPSDYGIVPPYEATQVVRSYGMRPVSRPVRTGRNYIVTAVDRYGQMRRVVVDARFGEVVRIVGVNRDAPYGYRRGFYYDDDVVVRPPRSLGGWRDGPPRPRARVPEDFDRLGPTPRPRPDSAPPPQASIPAEPEAVVRPQDPARIMEEEAVPATRAPDAARAPDTARAPDAGEASPGDPAAVQLPPPPRVERTPTPAPTPRARPQGENRRAATTPSQPLPPRPVPAEKKPPAPSKQTASPRVILPGGPPPKAEPVPPSEAAAPPAGSSSGLPPVNTLE